MLPGDRPGIDTDFVTVDIAGQQIVSAITRASAERLRLAEGTPATVFIKATEIILGVE